jgi:hypothetical protein
METLAESPLLGAMNRRLFWWRSSRWLQLAKAPAPVQKSILHQKRIHIFAYLIPFFSTYNGSNIVSCWLDIFIVIFPISFRKWASRWSAKGLIAKHNFFLSSTCVCRGSSSLFIEWRYRHSWWMDEWMNECFPFLDQYSKVPEATFNAMMTSDLK